MKRIAIGAVTGLAVWLTSAVAAEAQQITPTGPLSIYSNQTDVTYSATITTNYSFWIYLTITNNGAQVQTYSLHVTQSGPSYNFVSPDFSTSTWGLVAGDVINFHLRVAVTATYGWTSDYPVTVVAPSGPTSKSILTRPEAEGMMAKTLPTSKAEGEDRLALKEEMLA